ncbi:bacterioferritin [Xanthomonas translucens pv. arrhenatheri]|jgi:bacterioferritin|uniref:Putative bacterioferritin n=1 Tax=Xanthomonas graminis pv. arrhenatheri LMG 727 TaxID=1195923 RepID=A0A0K2ZUW6_9XANT|nr:ferritin-like domain-containing protein [Xanthomonas translucens]OAX66742.1 bacterioferritin [Xanthomonas translucens pv. arrhenatheri]UKE78575.1 ferritin-like domain-containing protein [Xanthomonas translucens pv. arrhenatheri]WIH05864.1 ferritin-like domain-containing protein [Xanthomonas translucens pv. graminis]CTP87949.1 putative bacterioferritin [Xanthomonas translucens pv. arrhenatheri LMG 727]
MSNKPANDAKPLQHTAGLTDTATLRANARQSIEDGAITKSYSADREAVIKLLNDALATEYVCVLRYYRHYFMASGMLADAIKGEFLEHAQQEQEHAHKLAERIVQLGGEPDLNPDTLTARSHAEYKEGEDLRDMVKENLIAERIAIDSYREMINFIGDKDTTTKRILEQILAQEEEHADEFSDLLEGWIGK